MNAADPGAVFRERFGRPPQFRVRAPGRVNLIGEHTDYNEGFVLPAAIDRYVVVAAQATGEETLRFLSLAHAGEEIRLPADRPKDPAVPAWGRYVQGVAGELIRAGVALRGVAAVVGGDLPIGAGLSSSAALEVAVALTLLEAAGQSRERREIALQAQRAEVEFVGVRCGIMDQFTVALARAGHALFLDCRTLAHTYVPLPEGLALVVCDTGVPRTLDDSAYNTRRWECEEAVRQLQRTRPEIRALRDLTAQDLALVEGLPAPLHRRARHVMTENERVHAAVAALRRGDGPALGRLLAASHQSLRDDFEVSVPALEQMVAAAAAAPGCLGARLVGAGFGGAVLALVERSTAAAFVAAAAAAYRGTAVRDGSYLVCAAVGGAEVLRPAG
jgi:galactokinase